MNAVVKRFDFSGLRDFTAPPPPIEIVSDNTLPEAEDLAPPPPLTFSEEELGAAKAEAWEEGRQAGVKEEAERQNTEAKHRDQAIEQACQTLALHISTLATTHVQFMQTQTEELSTLVLMLARKVAGDAIEQLPQSGVESMINDCLAVLQQQPKVMVVVHPSIAEAVDSKLKVLVDQYHLDTHVTVKGNEAFGAGEAKLEWQDGSAERRLDTIWQQIEGMIAQIDFTQLAPSATNTAPVPSQPVPTPQQEEAPAEAQAEPTPTTNDNENEENKGEQA